MKAEFFFLGVYFHTYMSFHGVEVYIRKKLPSSLLADLEQGLGFQVDISRDVSRANLKFRDDAPLEI